MMWLRAAFLLNTKHNQQESCRPFIQNKQKHQETYTSVFCSFLFSVICTLIEQGVLSVSTFTFSYKGICGE